MELKLIQLTTRKTKSNLYTVSSTNMVTHIYKTGGYNHKGNSYLQTKNYLIVTHN